MAIAGLILFWQLILPPVVGVSNNADFGKLLGRFGLGAPDEFQYANTRYEFNDRYRFQSGFWSSELLLILPALAINMVISKDGSFDLRLIGVIHASLFLLALAWFVPLLTGISRRVRIAICAAALFMFCDFGYAGYFNAFYMDVTAYLFLMLAVVLYLRVLRFHKMTDSVLLLICVGMVITSKAQYAIFGLWFAVLFWAARDALWGARKTVAVAAPLAILLTAGIAFRTSGRRTTRPRANSM